MMSVVAVGFGQVDSVILKIEQKYEENILLEEINGQYIPRDITEALAILDEQANEAAKEALKSAQEDMAVERLMRGLGQWMVLHWHFVDGSRLSHFIRQKGVSFPDDMAELLIRCYLRQLKGHDLEMDRLISHFVKKRKKEMEMKHSGRTEVKKKQP